MSETILASATLLLIVVVIVALFIGYKKAESKWKRIKMVQSYQGIPTGKVLSEEEVAVVQKEREQETAQEQKEAAEAVELALVEIANNLLDYKLYRKYSKLIRNYNDTFKERLSTYIGCLSRDVEKHGRLINNLQLAYRAVEQGDDVERTLEFISFADGLKDELKNKPELRIIYCEVVAELNNGQLNLL